MYESLCYSSKLLNECEIIFINDASSDGTENWLISLSDSRVKHLSNKHNLGYAKSNNLGVAHATGDVIILLNNDLEFKSEFLDPMISLLGSPHLNVGIVGNIQRQISDGSIHHAGFELSLEGKFLHTTLLPNADLQYSKVCAVTGACLAIRKSDFDAVGGFDENFLNGGEDLDLCFKVTSIGKSIYVAHKSQIMHYVALTRDPNSLQNEKNSQYLFRKWRPEIKNMLSQVWRSLLSCEVSYTSLLDGSLYDEFKSTPCVAARIIAENKISREEHRWSQLINNKDLNVDIGNKVSIHGTRFNQSLIGYLVDDEIEITLINTESIENFYICGRTLTDGDVGRLEIAISVNTVQYKIVPLGLDKNINVGIINPILLTGIDNTITVSIRRKVDNNLFVGSGKSILVTHFVLDDKIINIF